jgi:hypothetical protein
MSAVLDSQLTGKTYKLPPRTVSLIEVLSHEYGTQAKVLAAVAYSCPSRTLAAVESAGSPKVLKV